LNGITRRKIIDLCADNQIPVFEKDFSLTQVYSAEEAFVTGTFGGLTPVVSVDGRQIGNGQPGAMTRRLREMYLGLIARYTEQHHA
jgi:branched-chain amino acid aminotransferase